MRLFAKYSLAAFIRTLISIILLSGPVLCGDTKIESDKSRDSLEIPFAFKIDYVNIRPAVSLPIIKLRGSEEIYGFDFLLAYDANVLKFQGVDSSPAIFGIPGQYEWEYFTYRLISWDGGNSLPSGMLRVVALADESGDIHRPKKYIIDNNAILFTLHFTVCNDRFDCFDSSLVRFIWTDCGDNTVAFRFRGDSIYDVKTAISRNVFDLTHIKITKAVSSFPTYYGVPDTCSGKSPREAKRLTDFYNGGVQPRHLEPDLDGDLNLNGAPRELADETLFYDYFVTGPRAFTINQEGQRAATDMNHDGKPLTVQDYREFQIRIGNGYISRDTINCRLNLESRDSTLRISYDPDSSISVIWLWFLAPNGAIDCPEWATRSQTGDTIRIFAPRINKTFKAGPIELKYHGVIPNLIYYEAAGINGEAIKFDIIQ